MSFRDCFECKGSGIKWQNSNESNQPYHGSIDTYFGNDLMCWRCLGKGIIFENDNPSNEKVITEDEQD